MRIQHALLHGIHRVPRFKGRDRLTSLLSRSSMNRPTLVEGGLLMELDVSEWLQLDLLVTGSTEPLTISLIEKLIKNGDVVIDVGAHVGHHALVAAQATGSLGCVYTFDPQPYNCDRLARNACWNGFSHIKVMCAAIGDRDGFVNFPLQSESDRARLSFAEDGPNDLNVIFETPIRRLDSFIDQEKIKSVSLVKIDVEGFELEVLMGLEEKLMIIDNIIFEFLEGSNEKKIRKILHMLSKSGFKLKDVIGNDWKFGDALPERNIWASSEA